MGWSEDFATQIDRIASGTSECLRGKSLNTTHL